MQSFLLAEWLEIGLVGHIQKFELCQYIGETFLSGLLIMLPPLHFRLHRTLPHFNTTLPRSSLSSLYYLSAHTFLFSRLAYKGISRCFVLNLIQFIFQIDFLYSEYQSSLCAIFDRYVVVAIEEVFGLLFLGETVR